MAEKLDQKETVGFEELLLSNIYNQEALINLLEAKGIIKKAELLPTISLTRPKTFLGRDTVSSMKSGIVYGYSFLVEGILDRLKKKFKNIPQVVATGGEADLIAAYCTSINKVEQNLTLEGLRLAYKKYVKNT